MTTQYKWVALYQRIGHKDVRSARHDIARLRPKRPRISALQIHEWIYEQLHLREEEVHMVEVDGPRRRVFIKFVYHERMQEVIRTTQGQLEFHHENGELLSLVQVDRAGLGMRRIRLQTYRRRCRTEYSKKQCQNTAR